MSIIERLIDFLGLAIGVAGIVAACIAADAYLTGAHAAEAGAADIGWLLRIVADVLLILIAGLLIVSVVILGSRARRKAREEAREFRGEFDDDVP